MAENLQPEYNGYLESVKSHWLKHRPKAVAALKKQGRLQSEMEAAAKATEDLELQLKQQGMNPYEAINLSRREHMVLPDLDEEASEA